MAFFPDFTPFLEICIFRLEIDRLFDFLEYLEHSKSLDILSSKTSLVEKVQIFALAA